MTTDKPYIVTVTTRIKLYMSEDEAYDNHTHNEILFALADDIYDRWTTPADCVITVTPMEDISFDEIGQYQPWNGATNDGTT